ncbi:MAG TPA: pyridoxamine 5'-phosphate oxidase [Candidatus Acidoferrales bacterium]|nr:pyridoxamine 5'-phosphate oxidase [Candidatus Acidoferrales bacterium]
MSIEEHIKNLRREYSGEPLDEAMVDPDPFRQFEEWFNEAIESEISDPHAMVVATVSQTERPSARVVLLRGIDGNGFVFYTNYRSRKGVDILRNPNVAAVFFWSELHRQVRVEGSVEKVSSRESDNYFHSRPRESQVGAWASIQSEIISDREELDRHFKEYERRFEGKLVPRPDSWGGFRIIPEVYEFWQGRPNRLHDRILYKLDKSGGWKISRLAP